MAIGMPFTEEYFTPRSRWHGRDGCHAPTSTNKTSSQSETTPPKKKKEIACLPIQGGEEPITAVPTASWSALCGNKKMATSTGRRRARGHAPTRREWAPLRSGPPGSTNPIQLTRPAWASSPARLPPARCSLARTQSLGLLCFTRAAGPVPTRQPHCMPARPVGYLPGSPLGLPEGEEKEQACFRWQWRGVLASRNCARVCHVAGEHESEGTDC